MASLLDRSGTYYAQFYDSDRTPSRKRFSLQTKRKRDARQKLTELEQAREDGEFDPWTDDPFNYADTSRPLTLSQTIERFAQEKKRQGCAERTVSTYENVWRRFTDRIEEEEARLEDITAADVETFVHDDSVSESTRHKRFRHVRAILKHFNRSGVLEGVHAPSRPDKLPTPVREDDLSAVIRSLKKDYRDKRRRNCVRPGQMIWAVAPIRFAFLTGLRSSEIGRLKWRHIDRERGLIRIERQKNGRQQTIPLVSKAADVLDETPHPRGSDCYVFRTPDGPLQDRNAEAFGRRCSRRWCEARQECDSVSNKTFHDLRAGFATQLADAGMSAHKIRDAMRHADISTSLKYVRVSNQRLKSDMEQAFS